MRINQGILINHQDLIKPLQQGSDGLVLPQQPKKQPPPKKIAEPDKIEALIAEQLQSEQQKRPTHREFTLDTEGNEVEQPKVVHINQQQFTSDNKAIQAYNATANLERVDAITSLVGFDAYA